MGDAAHPAGRLTAGTGSPMFSVHIDTARSWRGGQNQVLLTMLGLRKRGHRAVLVAHPDGELYRRASGRTDLFPLAIKTEIDLRAAWHLSRLFKSLHPDVIHAHDAHSIAIAVLARSLAGHANAAPVVASRRVDFHVGHNVFSRLKYHQVDQFLCASRAIRDMLVSDGVPTERTTVVHEGIDLTQVDDAPTLDLHREFCQPVGAPIVGNVAALAPHKGQQYLIESIALVLREVPDARFLIVGAGDLKDTLARQIHRLRLDNHVILTGFRTDVLSILKGLDLFVMSSVTEGLCTSVLDAMAAGKAVVATRAGGIPESVIDDHTGLLVPVRDATGLAHAIVTLLKDEARRRAFGIAGRHRAQEVFNADRMVDETAGVYAVQVDTTRARDNDRHPETP